MEAASVTHGADVGVHDATNKHVEHVESPESPVEA